MARKLPCSSFGGKRERRPKAMSKLRAGQGRASSSLADLEALAGQWKFC